MDQGSLKQELVQPRLSGIGVKEYPVNIEIATAGTGQDGVLTGAQMQDQHPKKSRR